MNSPHSLSGGTRFDGHTNVRGRAGHTFINGGQVIYGSGRFGHSVATGRSDQTTSG